MHDSRTCPKVGIFAHSFIACFKATTEGKMFCLGPQVVALIIFSRALYTVRKKRNLTARKVQNIFSLLKGVYSFWDHYYREKNICNSRTVKFLFLTTVLFAPFGVSTYFW